MGRFIFVVMAVRTMVWVVFLYMILGAASSLGLCMPDTYKLCSLGAVNGHRQRASKPGDDYVATLYPSTILLRRNQT